MICVHMPCSGVRWCRGRTETESLGRSKYIVIVRDVGYVIEYSEEKLERELFAQGMIKLRI